MSCLTLRSRSGVPICPRKYFETTMLVACCDQKRGISTSRCSKTTCPFSLPMTADLTSHSTSSNGSIPSWLKNLTKSRPAAGADVAGRVVVSPLVVSTCGAAPLCILPLRKRRARRPAPWSIDSEDLQIVAGSAHATRRSNSSSPEDTVRQASPRPVFRSKSHACQLRCPGCARAGKPRGSRGLADARGLIRAKAGTIMAPVYVVVKSRSTTYCVLFCSVAQDMDNWAERRGLLLNDLF